MARMIGKGKSGLWWLGGLLCAMVFGRAAAGEIPRPVALYGVRVRPRPPVDEKAVTAEQKQQAGKLVAEYLADPQEARPSDEEKGQIAKLIKELGSEQFAAREAASKAIVKFGAKALAQLREAEKGAGDAEVLQRARKAIAEIQSGNGAKVAAELRKVRNAAHVVIREKMAEQRTAAYKARLSAISLEKAGKADEAKIKRAEEAAASQKVARLTRLYNLVVYGTAEVPRIERRLAPAYGIRPQG